MSSNSMSIEKLPIAGERVTTDDTIAVIAPYDGRELGRVPKCGPAEVDRAVRAARDAMSHGALPPWRRAETLDIAARLLTERNEDFARTIALEAAKPIKTARIEAERAVATFTFAAAEARVLAGDMVPLDASAVGEGKLGFTLRLPIGVVGAISPFNFQLLLVECGLPGDQLSVVTGGGGSVGNALVEHDGVALITFTGSPEVGWGIKERAPRKKVGLELGNNAPVIVEPGSDYETAARKVSVAGFSHAGQSCISTQRIFVHRSVADDFLGALVPLVQALRVGDPLDEQTDVSALITTGDRDRVKSWIDDAVAGGASVLAGGDVRDGMLEPTVLVDVTPEMKVCSHEVFGPVVGVARYDDVGDAIRLANDTRYGLQAAIYTPDLETALRAAHELDFGAVLVNEVPTWRTDQMPYGGVRDSGNTREGPRYAIREMTEERLVVIQP